MTTNNWQPSANLYALQIRAEVLAKIREFFAIRKVMEVETPLLCKATVTDPHIESLSLIYQHHKYYLQTSPEFAMKRLLAAGSGPIYQICKAFRAEEAGRLHNPEFTMLEWYRPGFTHRDLMIEVDGLLRRVLNCQVAKTISYQELFLQYCGFDPLTINLSSLKIYAKQNELAIHRPDDIEDVTTWLQLIMAHQIEPHLGFHDQPTIVIDFPQAQAALAKLDKYNPLVAERFEVYWQGMELANGFHELCDANEQRQRFLEDNVRRKQRGLTEISLDEPFLNALTHGLPPCSGVALGIDRLVMAATQLSAINETLTFPF